MSTITYDFNSVCINCRGIDCDFDNRHGECTDIADDIMTTWSP